MCPDLVTSSLNDQTRFSHGSEIFFSGGILSRQSSRAQLFSISEAPRPHKVWRMVTSGLHSSLEARGWLGKSLDFSDAEYCINVTRNEIVT